ncbi:MAG: hypothetical protein JWO60_2493, partial [Frankiales bacterium]|nr:hypothetical protein [Frankiales bacterium]
MPVDDAALTDPIEPVWTLAQRVPEHVDEDSLYET